MAITRPALAAAAVTLAACACGSSTSVATPTPTASATLDRCLVGTWRSTSISGALAISGGPVTLTGGAGEVLTIAPSGAVRTDDTATAPVTGVASDGTAYKLVQSGTATGTISAASGRAAVTLNQPTQLTVTLYRNGAVLQSQHPGAATDSYVCTSGSRLTITSGGGTVVTYVPG